MNIDRSRAKSLVAEALVDASLDVWEPSEQWKIYSDSPLLEGLSIADIRLYLTQFQNEGYIKFIGEGEYSTKQRYFFFEGVYMNPLLDYFEIPISKNEEKVYGPKSYFIEFNDDRRVLLNGSIELSKPDFEGVNEVTFRFLYNHPNQIFKKEFIESKTKMKIGSLDKMVENLGFRRDFKHAFFDIGGDSIRFKNPVNI